MLSIPQVSTSLVPLGIYRRSNGLELLGTTGTPKGVSVSHRNVTNCTTQIYLHVCEAKSARSVVHLTGEPRN